MRKEDYFSSSHSIYLDVHSYSGSDECAMSPSPLGKERKRLTFTLARVRHGALLIGERAESRRVRVAGRSAGTHSWRRSKERVERRASSSPVTCAGERVVFRLGPLVSPCARGLPLVLDQRDPAGIGRKGPRRPARGTFLALSRSGERIRSRDILLFSRALDSRVTAVDFRRRQAHVDGHGGCHDQSVIKRVLGAPVLALACTSQIFPPLDCPPPRYPDSVSRRHGRPGRFFRQERSEESQRQEIRHDRRGRQEAGRNGQANREAQAEGEAGESRGRRGVPAHRGKPIGTNAEKDVRLASFYRGIPEPRVRATALPCLNSRKSRVKRLTATTRDVPRISQGALRHCQTRGIVDARHGSCFTCACSNLSSLLPSLLSHEEAERGDSM